jgi:hypothetical protein
LEKTWRRGQNERCDRSTRARHAPPSRCSGARPRSSRASLGILPRSRRASAIRHRRASWRAQLGGRVESASWTALGRNDARRMMTNRLELDQRTRHGWSGYLPIAKNVISVVAHTLKSQKHASFSTLKIVRVKNVGSSDSPSRTVRETSRWSDLCCNFQGRRLTPRHGSPGSIRPHHDFAHLI